MSHYFILTVLFIQFSKKKPLKILKPAWTENSLFLGRHSALPKNSRMMKNTV